MRKRKLTKEQRKELRKLVYELMEYKRNEFKTKQYIARKFVAMLEEVVEGDE